ncbi:MAG: RluA family pseudouridine synthase, partial [Muribaculaceae bacterium]|nr:RluA family pseudouridine synthase [Muribaculaceae bacterium]
CLPILTWMLQGLDIEPPLDTEIRSIAHIEPRIIFENRWFCIVDKPSGMLSVPGKGSAVSVQEWLQEKYGQDRQVKMVHRLDQDTSGLLIASFGPLSFKLLQTMFAMRKVKKTYIAVLEGDYESMGIPRSGRIELSLSPDWLDRPRQRVDMKEGKEAVTDYEFIEVNEGRSRVMFHPRTGRTHQLRVHAASEMGLGMPIVGDRLYGMNTGKESDRLHLHAHKIEFTFPIDRQYYSFESHVPF